MWITLDTSFTCSFLTEKKKLVAEIEIIEVEVILFAILIIVQLKYYKNYNNTFSCNY